MRDESFGDASIEVLSPREPTASRDIQTTASIRMVDEGGEGGNSNCTISVEPHPRSNPGPLWHQLNAILISNNLGNINSPSGREKKITDEGVHQTF